MSVPIFLSNLEEVASLNNLEMFEFQKGSIQHEHPTSRSEKLGSWTHVQVPASLSWHAHPALPAPLEGRKEKNMYMQNHVQHQHQPV